MNHKIIHVYLVPGMAAGPEIFRNIRLPKERYLVHILEWFLPEKGESLSCYARRMAALVKEEHCILIGVSFGGLVVQEMTEFLNPTKIIIISSVKSENELPRRMRFAGRSFLYKLIPTRFIFSAEDLTRFVIGPKTKQKLRIYQEYLHMRDKEYLDWAIRNMVCWKQRKSISNLFHIHGDLDTVFPIKNVKNCEIIPGGSHVMILNKGKLVSEKIIEIIEKK